MNIKTWILICLIDTLIIFILHGFTIVVSFPPLLAKLSQQTDIKYLDKLSQQLISINYEEYLSNCIERGINQARSAAIEKAYYKAGQARKKFTRKYDTIAGWQLDTEYNVNSTLSQKHYDIIDNAIDYVKEIISQQRNWQNMSETTRANIILVTIHAFLQKYHKNSATIKEMLLSRCLDKKALDCDTGTVIYLSIGEALNLPIVAVHVIASIGSIEHMFVRWNLQNKSCLNWETTKNDPSLASMSDEEQRAGLAKMGKIQFVVIKDRNEYKNVWKRQLYFAYNLDASDDLQ